jgi:predicted dehydrogenase
MRDPSFPRPDEGGANCVPVHTSDSHDPMRGRRSFLQRGGAGLAAVIANGAAGSAWAAAPAAAQANAIKLSLIQDPDAEQKEETPDANLRPDGRIGYAIVGLGRLSLNQILPALLTSKYSKVAALVSGDRVKALKIAHQYGAPETSIYDYQDFERLGDNPRVQVVYVVLPNAMHREYTERARIGKHVLCEKPMATSVPDCEAMVAACKSANRKLMIAYRSQYEPMDRMIANMVKENKLGALRDFVAGNSQNVGDPTQWRLKLALAGGGPMPDVSVYCLNAARFISGEEPYEAVASTARLHDDPRFTEVESSVHFVLRFPSSFTAPCMASYAGHESRFFRVQGPKGWVEMNPAFSYNGLRLRHGMLADGRNAATEIIIDRVDQFAREIDHMSRCVIDDKMPHTPGEEGLQDQRIIEAIYESARTGRAVKIAKPPGPTRGPEPEEETF